MADGTDEHDRLRLAARHRLHERKSVRPHPHDRPARPGGGHPGRALITDDGLGHARVADAHGDAHARIGGQDVGEYAVGVSPGDDGMHADRCALTGDGGEDGRQTAVQHRCVLDDHREVVGDFAGDRTRRRGGDRPAPVHLHLQRVGHVLPIARRPGIDHGDDVRQFSARRQGSVWSGDENEGQPVWPPCCGEPEHERRQQFASGRIVVADQHCVRAVTVAQRDDRRAGPADTDDGSGLDRPALPRAGDGNGVIRRPGEVGFTDVGQRDRQRQLGIVGLPQLATVGSSELTGAVTGQRDVESARAHRHGPRPVGVGPPANARGPGVQPRPGPCRRITRQRRVGAVDADDDGVALLHVTSAAGSDRSPVGDDDGDASVAVVTPVVRQLPAPRPRRGVRVEHQPPCQRPVHHGELHDHGPCNGCGAPTGDRQRRAGPQLGDDGPVDRAFGISHAGEGQRIGQGTGIEPGCPPRLAPPDDGGKHRLRRRRKRQPPRLRRVDCSDEPRCPPLLSAHRP